MFYVTGGEYTDTSFKTLIAGTEEEYGPFASEDEALATVNAVKRLVDHVMYWPRGHAPRRWRELAAFGDEAGWADRSIIGVAFYRWMAVILRGRNPGDNPYLGPGAPEVPRREP